MRSKLLLLFFVLFSLHALAGTNVDSLKQALNSASTTTAKVDALNALGFAVRVSDSEQSKQYLDQSLQLSYDSDYQQGYGQALNNLGCLFQITGETDSSLVILEQAVAVFEQANLSEESGKARVNKAISHYYLGDLEAAIETAKIAIPQLGDNKKRVASTYLNIGLFYRNAGKYPEAVQNYVYALIIFKELGLKEREIDTRNNIGVLYEAYQQYDQSLAYHKQAYDAAKLLNYELGIAYSLAGMGLTYRNLKRYDESLSATREAGDLFKKTGQNRPYANTLANLGLIHESIGNSDQALLLYGQADSIFESMNDIRGMAALNANIGTIYYEIKQYEKAKEYYEKAHSNVRFIKARNMLKSLYINLANTYEKLGMKDKSLQFHHRYNAIKDSIFNLEAVEKMTEIETKYQIEEKEAELEQKDEELKKTKSSNENLGAFISQLWYWVGALIVLLVIIAVAFLRKQSQTKALCAQKEEMVSKYNSLEEAYQNIYHSFNKIAENPQGEEQETPAPNFPDYLTQLSKRELEVLSCLSIGLTDKEIAEKLFISVTTVRTHCRRIYEKLQVKNRAEAANFAREYKLI